MRRLSRRNSLEARNVGIFVFVFAKNARDNIANAELLAFKQLALELFQPDQAALNKAVAAGSLIEICGDAR
ncbi:MAG TPA: type II toxin-antitoxin system RelE/ParE family toxin [Candidatus Elarobacter sp.]